MASPGLTTKCGAWPVSGWPVVPVRPWSRFFSVDDLSCPILSFSVLLASRFLGYRLGPFVYAFQCLTGKFDNNNNNNKICTHKIKFIVNNFDTDIAPYAAQMCHKKPHLYSYLLLVPIKILYRNMTNHDQLTAIFIMYTYMHQLCS